jgi:hypothetical protein
MEFVKLPPHDPPEPQLCSVCGEPATVRAEGELLGAACALRTLEEESDPDDRSEPSPVR